jgi:murein DD-endopeptidase MepM/ murein hydrolase activator NlpD
MRPGLSLYIALLSVLCYFEVSSCVPVPEEKLLQLKLNIERELVGDSLLIRVINPVYAPLEFELQSSNTLIERAVKGEPLVILRAYDTFQQSWFIDSLETIDTSGFASLLKVSLHFSATEFTEDRPEIELPFPQGYRYRIIQAYNGQFSHRSDYSRFAIDFSLSVGDTICAVADGYVTGLIDGYTVGGNSKKLRDYANFITIYHPEGGFYTQYVHLSPRGVLVRLNDWVTSGQAIALSGETGFTASPHLHFNVLQPIPGKSPVSAPINFVEGYKGADLRKNSWVRKPNN